MKVEKIIPIYDGEVILIKEFCDLINQKEESADVLEFGTGGGRLVNYIASNISKERKIFTFDGFVGLPETSKVIPEKSGWNKGAYCFNEEDVRRQLNCYPNVFIEKTMTWDLKHPNEYGISKIVAANMDLDLYEGTLDGLRFIDKCVWTTLLLRFDDWGAHPHQNASEIDEHEKSAFFDWITETDYEYMIDKKLVDLTNGQQSIINVTR